MVKGILVMAIIFMVGCMNDSPEQVDSVEPEFLEHENGLSTYVHFEYVSRLAIDNGFYFDANVTGSRGGNSIRLEVLESDEIEDYKTREIGDVKYKYRIEEVLGGNGPPQYQLTIWKPVVEKVIRLKNYVQKDGEPDFGRSWSLIENATVQE